MSRSASAGWIASSILAAFAACSAGCGGAPQARTTFLRGVDLVDMTDRMGESFAQSDALAQRSAADDLWIVSLSKVTNQTSQIIPEGERWLYLARLRSALSQARVGGDRGIIWIIPAEKWSMIQGETDLPDEPFGVREDPTHVMTAEFHSLTRTGPEGRSDMYVCSYQLIDLGDGRLVWEDSWEVKRAVRGLTFD